MQGHVAGLRLSLSMDAETKLSEACDTEAFTMYDTMYKTVSRRQTIEIFQNETRDKRGCQYRDMPIGDSRQPHGHCICWCCDMLVIKV